MEILVKLHSVLRYAVLLAILYALFKSYSGMSGKKSFTGSDKKAALFGLIFSHVQLLIGIILYFGNSWASMLSGNMANKVIRFYGMEHVLMMVIAIALITVGYSKSKKAETDEVKFKKIAVFYTIGLILILASIPWPFRAEIGRALF